MMTGVNEEMAPKLKRSRNKITLFLFLRLGGIILFIIILTKIDILEVWNQLKLVRLNVILITLGFVMTQLCLKAIRWHLLNTGTLNAKAPVRSFGEFFESYAIGLITPGRLGELLKAGYSSDRSGKISTGVRVFVERGLDFGFFLCVAGSALAWRKIITQNLAWGLFIVFLGLISIGFSITLLRSEKIYLILSRFVAILRISKQPLNFKIQSGYFSLWIVMISLVSNSVYFLSCYLLARNISFDAGLLYVSGGIAVAGLLNTVPITVMGLGTRELAFLYVFGDYPAAVIIAFSALIFLCWQIGSGLLSLITGEILMTRPGGKKIY